MFIKHLPRPCIQRTFVRWLDKNRTRFEVPVHIRKITADSVNLTFQGYPDCLSVSLSAYELNVHVNWQGRWWDMLISLDAWAFHTLGGYKCKCCWIDYGESATNFPSRESLWLDHLFDPFLQWVNEELTPARWLQISGTKDVGATWAKLIRDENALDKPDRTLLLMQRLIRIDGTPAYEGGSECVRSWLIPLKSD